MLRVYFNSLIDTNSHPEMENITKRSDAIALAKQTTTNPITPLEFAPGDYLVFSEIILVDDTAPEYQGVDTEFIINDLKPQAPDAEYSTHRKWHPK
jgi:hypothetical protein